MRFSEAHLLGTSLVDDLGLVLCLLPILPRQVYYQLARVFVVACVDRVNIILPRPCWWLPHLGRNRRRAIPGMVGLPALSRRRCARRRPAALLALDALLRVFEDLLFAAVRFEVGLKDIVCVLRQVFFALPGPVRLLVVAFPFDLEFQRALSKSMVS